MDYDQLKRLVRESYPFPIALAHKKMLGMLDDNMEKLKNIFETAEVTIQFLAVLALAQARKDLAEGKAPERESLKQAIRLNQTSFGSWHNILKGIMKAYYGFKSQLMVPELFDFCFIETSDNKLNVQPIHNKSLNPIRELRNDYHHGRLPENKIKDSVSDGLRWLHHLLEEVQFLADYRLSFTQRIMLNKSADLKMSYVHDLTVFNGCFSQFDQERWPSEIDLQKDAVILLHPKANKYLTLSPFVIFTDKLKDVPDVYLLNNVSGNKIVYVSCQFHQELNSATKGWKEGSLYKEGITDFLNQVSLLKTSEDKVEVDDLPIPPDESTLSTAEVFQIRYRVAKDRIEYKSPYKFLDYYNPEDYEIFFGRDNEIRQLQQKFYNSRLLVLHGESGTGKTSLIRAGLIPSLSPDTYVPVYVRAVKEPLREIKKELIRQLKLDERHADLPLANFFIKETERLSKTVVIILDQFEEFFLRFPDEIRKTFEKELAECLEITRIDVKFLISLRADYFSYLAGFEKSIPQIFTHQIQLPHLTEKQAEDAILKPPEKLGMKIDEAMVRTKLLPELTSAEGVEAPLLQIVCDALYQHAQSEGKTEIGESDYQAVGDVKGALSNYLNTRLKEFGKDQPKAKAVLKAMVTAEGTKRASFPDELVSRVKSTGMEIEIEEAKTYLNKFVSYRLVRVDDVEGNARYELSHEYMVKHIWAWIEESEREITKMLELIDRAYEAYQATGLLLESGGTEMIEPFEEQLSLTPEKEKFVTDSKNQVMKKRRGLLLKVGTLLMIVALIIGGVFGYQTYQAYQETKKQRDIAEKNAKEAKEKQIEARHKMGFAFNEKAEKALESKNFNTARLYALHAIESFDPDKSGTEKAKAAGIVLSHPDYPIIFSSPDGSHHNGHVNSVSFSPDRKTMASGSSDKTIRLWDVETGKEIKVLNTLSVVLSVCFSSDGTLASGAEDNVIRLWDVKTGKEIRTLIGHSDFVRSVDFSLDGKTLASGSDDKTIRLWDAKTGKELNVLNGHTDSVTSVNFSLDRKTLASGSNDKTIRLWDVQTGKELKVLTGHTDNVRSVNFSRDSNFLASGADDSTIRLWNVQTGEVKHVLSNHKDQIRSVCFSQDGKTLVSGSLDNTIRLWDVQTGKQNGMLTGHTSGVLCVNFSTDGKTLASGAKDATIRLWDVETRKEKGEKIGHSDSIITVNFSSDGRTLASGGEDNTIRLWDVESGKEKKVLIGHSASVRSVCFSSDGETLASGSDDKTIRLWNAETGKEKILLPGHSAPVWSVCFSPDGKTLASGSQDKTIRLWNVETGEQKESFTGPIWTITSVNFSPNGKILAVGGADWSIWLWDLETREVRKLSKPAHQGTCISKSITFSPDGKTLASGIDVIPPGRYFVALWNLETGKMKTLPVVHSASVQSVSFSPDGNTLASGSDDKTIVLWDIETERKKRILTGHSASVCSVVFSSDGTLASASRDKTIRLWNVERSKEKSVLAGHSEGVTTINFSSDGKTLASGSWDNTIRLWDIAGTKSKVLAGQLSSVYSVCFSSDRKTLAAGLHNKTIHLWDTETGKEKKILTGHSAPVRSISFSQDGKTLASGSDDKSIRIWDAETGNEKKILTGHSAPVWSVAFSSDGNILASGSNDKTIRLWDVETGKEKKVMTGHSDSVLSVGFSPDGNSLVSLASGPNDDNTIIRLWDVATGKETGILKGHTNSVYSAIFSPDGNMIASGSEDKTIRLWDVKTRKEQCLLTGHTDYVTCLSFSTDGKTLASGSYDHTIRLWDLPLFYEVSHNRLSEERLKEAEQSYNLKLVNFELQSIPPERNLYGVKSIPPEWPNNHPLHWLTKAKSGNTDAMVQLGLIYDRDNKNDEALSWYQKSANAGNVYGKERLEILNKFLSDEEKIDQTEVFGQPEAPLKPQLTDREFINHWGMKFVYIPPGTFMMGSPASEKGRNDNEQQHMVTLTNGFYIQTTEVTQGQWKAVVGNNPSRFNTCGDNCPVELVSWYSIQDMIQKMNQIEGAEKYRLPTEAEWEYAAKAGTSSAFSWGNSPNCSYANYGNRRDSFGDIGCKFQNPGMTKPVGSFAPNAWGLFDMHGNVLEWCQDWYSEKISDVAVNPIGPDSGKDKVLRGGAWDAGGSGCRAASRGGFDPKYGTWTLGFRLVMNP